jgi:hypothetical protein
MKTKLTPQEKLVAEIYDEEDVRSLLINSNITIDEATKKMEKFQKLQKMYKDEKSTSKKNN